MYSAGIQKDGELLIFIGLRIDETPWILSVSQMTKHYLFYTNQELHKAVRPTQTQNHVKIHEIDHTSPPLQHTPRICYTIYAMQQD